MIGISVMKELITCVRTSQRCNQTPMMVLLTKIVSSVNLKTLAILPKSLNLIVWLDPGHVSADGYITILKNQMEICKDGRWIKIGSF